MLRPVLSGLLLAVGLAACSSKLTIANYDRLEMGMNYQQVVDILGKPDTCSDVLLARACRWGQAPRQIKVNFVSDKVVLFSAEGLQ